ncbi:MAG: CDP-glycerol glycerophosphotransferase family protein [Gemmatimonadota bacterium]|nr:CDP-glycerol glycerophosphotransferase family protein [Gemmatimonadota bacterium]MDH5759408.1 CDP-glycerol glycerophosphotransferase family protein [Gemmatimonadota bacterium]
MKTILFAGYAPVHFVCFEPIYRRLAARGDVRVELSGGREPDPEGRGALSAAKLYSHFDVPAERIVELPDMYEREYDMVFSAHISGYFPKADRKRVQVFHGLSFRNMAIRRDVLIYDNLFVIGPYMMRSLMEEKLFRPGSDRLVSTGFAKLDRLVDGSLKREDVLRRAGISGERPVILYAPTGQKGNSLESTGPEVIRRLRDTGEYDILLKLHDHPRNRAEPGRDELVSLLDDHTRMVDDFDIVPYLFLADLVISDASSVTMEYSLMDRPVVFLDVPSLLDSAEKSKKGRFDTETWGRRGGTVARWPDEAVKAVEWSLANPDAHGDVRRAMAEDLFFNPGKATDAAEAWITSELGLGSS